MSKHKASPLIEDEGGSKEKGSTEDYTPEEQETKSSCKGKLFLAVAVLAGLAVIGVVIFLIVFFTGKGKDKPINADNPYEVKRVLEYSDRCSLFTLFNPRGSKAALPGTTNHEPQFLFANISSVHDHHLSVRISDANHTRWDVKRALEVSDNTFVPGLMDVSGFIAMFQHYSFEQLGFNVTTSPFEWELWGAESERLKTHPMITTKDKRLLFKDKQIEFEVELRCETLLGLPQTSPSLKLVPKDYVIWNRYTVDSKGNSEDGVGGIPFIMCRVREDKFLGLFLDTSNAHQIRIRKKSDVVSINYMLTGGIIDFNLFHMGEPNVMVKMFHEYIGKPICPPLWSLGLQHSREGCDSIKELMYDKGNYTEHDMQLDAIAMTQTLMDDYKVFTVSTERFPRLRQVLEQWAERGIHFVQTILPQVKKAEYQTYNNITKHKAFVRDARDESSPVLTKGLNTQECIFLDTFHPNSSRIFNDGLKMVHVNSSFDGLWIRQDSPYTLCDGPCSAPHRLPPFVESRRVPMGGARDPNEFDDLPFEPVKLKNHTLPLSSFHNMMAESPEFAQQAKHFNLHNIFPLLYAKKAYETVRNDEYTMRVLFSSSVASPRMGKYAALWRNIQSDWSSLKTIVRETVAFNMAGVPVVSYPVCGYNGVGPDKLKLCLRWYQLSAYLPMLRVFHNNENPTEPYRYKSEKAVKQALDTRYSLIRFYYTRMTETELFGGSIWDPLAFIYPKDSKCYDDKVMDGSFVIGKTLYVVPALTEAEEVGVYLPNDDWYFMDNLTLIQEFDPKKESGKEYKLPASYNSTNTFLRGGYIIPVQNEPVHNTKDLSVHYVSIIVAPNHDGTARGTMLTARDIENELEQGFYNHYSFTYHPGVFRVNLLEGYLNPVEAFTDYFKEVNVLNYDNPNVDFACLLDNELRYHPLKFTYDNKKKILKMYVEGISMILLKSIESITFGDKSVKNLCTSQTILKDTKYEDNHKKVTGTLEASDSRTTTQYDLMFQMFSDQILYWTVEVKDGNKHWKVPEVVNRTKAKSSINLQQYQLVLSNDNSPFFFEILDHDKSKILSTQGHNFMYHNNFIEFDVRLYGSKIYGLGERVHRFELEDGWYSMFSKGVASPVETRRRPGHNMYGSYPFYLFKLADKSEFAGAFILSSNAMDVRVAHEMDKHIQLSHVLSGGILEMFFFQRSSAEGVVTQFHSLIGRPTLVPHWSFGYHQCRWGYETQHDLEEVIKNFTDNSIPLDVLWSDIDYMYKYQDFTLDKRRFPSMPVFLNNLKKKNITYVPIVDAGVARTKGYRPYDEGLQKDLFIKSAKTGKPLVGIVWPGYAVFTDFLHPEAESYWVENLKSMHKILPFDGIWLDMNECTNFCEGECPDELHYVDSWFTTGKYEDMVYYPTHNKLNDMTISTTGTHHGGVQEYDVHSMYGHYMIKATSKYLTKELGTRPFIISRSSFPGTGKYGSHWLGDNYAQLKFMRLSIPGVYNFHMFGIPLVGADACGFIGVVDLELCKRWMQLAAFYPFYRNHKEKFWGKHEPFVERELTKVSVHAIRIRYHIFRYMYSLYFSVAQFGGTFFRPLFWEFPHEAESYKHNEYTFMLGSAIKVSPAINDTYYPTTTSYFPNADWYKLFTGQKDVSYDSHSPYGKTLTLNCSYSPPEINLHLRGGYIVSLATGSGMNLKGTMHYPINIAVAPYQGTAHGFVYYDVDTVDTIEAKQYQRIDMEYSSRKLEFKASEKRNFDYPYGDDVVGQVSVYNAKEFAKTKCARAKLTDGSEKKVQFGFTSDTYVLWVYPEVRIDLLASVTWSDQECQP